jgi:hypothetical protein
MADKKTKPAPAQKPNTKTKKTPSAKSSGGKPQANGAPAAKAQASAERMLPPPRGVTVRMYRTGLGDCFLLAMPRAKKAADGGDAFYILIDCGIFKASPNAAEHMKDIAQHIKASTRVTDAKDAKSRIDVLVITHEHWDHVSGFHKSQAQSIFDQIDYGAVWLAWTENDDYGPAKELRAARRTARHALNQALGALEGAGQAAAHSETTALIRKVLDFFGGPVPAASGAGLGAAATGGAKSSATEEALDHVKNTYGEGRTHFLHPGDGPLPLNGVPAGDARIYILGPPEDTALIKHCNPSASGKEVYPRAMAAALEAAFLAAFGVVAQREGAAIDAEDAEAVKGRCFPFAKRYRIEADKAPAYQIDITDPESGARQPEAYFQARYFDAPAWRHIDTDWLAAAGAFALQLDSATNNTSLAFALEIGPPGEGKVLLFPGDAQVGNWLSWFGKVTLGHETYGKEMTWKVAGHVVTAEDLLHRTVLYKVGHHGSHNATLRDQGLKLMGRADGTGELIAMLPVDEVIARTKAGYGEMPLPSLVKDLLIRTGGRLTRNDEDNPIDPKGGNPTLAGVAGAPKRLNDFGSKHKTDLYIEYTVS